MKGRRIKGPMVSVTETYTMLSGGVNEAVGAGAAVALQARPIPNAVTLVQADHDNAGDIFVGGAFGQPIRLAAGESVTIAADASKIRVRASVAAQTVRWLALS